MIVGRRRELELIQSRLDPGEVVALTGASGMGKTTIAQEVVRTCGLKCVSVDCFGLQARDAAAATIAATGGVPGQSSSVELWVVAGSLLTEGDVELVLLDDIGFDFAQLDALRRAWNGRLLTTSHAVPDDATVLPITPVQVVEQAFERSEAYRLFEHAGQTEDLSFVVEPSEVDDVREIATLLDGHPLAICLAGRRAATTSVRTVRGLLEKGYVVEDLEQPERHQSHWAAIDFSWHGLPLTDQRRLYAMSLFDRPLRVEALAEVCDETLAEMLEGMRRLVRAGIVARGEFQQPLELFRDVAEQQFPQLHPEVAAAVLQRIETAAIDAARAVEPGLTPLLDLGEEPSLWKIVIDRGCAGLSDEDAGLVLAGWMRYVSIRGGAMGAMDIEAVHEQLDRVDQHQAWLQAARSRTMLDIELGLQWAERALQAATNPREVHDARILKSLCLSQMFRLDEALELFDSTFDERWDTPGIATVEIELGLLCDQRERAAAAIERMERKFGTTPLVLKAWVVEDPQLMDAYYRRAREESLSEGKLSRYAHTLNTHALILATRLLRIADALEALRESRALCEKLGSPRGLARSWIEEATVHLFAGAFEEAERTSQVPSATEAGPFAPTAGLIWAAALWQRGKFDTLRTEWPRLREPLTKDGRKYYQSLWRTVDLAVVDDDELEQRCGQHQDAFPQLEPVFAAFASCRRLTAHATFGEVLRTWQALETMAAQVPDHDFGARQVTLFAERAHPMLARLMVLRDNASDVVVLHDYTGHRAGGKWYDLSAQQVGAQLLRALVEADAPLDYDALGEALYADEFVQYEALTNRINVQISKLRKAGLKPYVIKEPEGFVLDAMWHVEEEP